MNFFRVIMKMQSILIIHEGEVRSHGKTAKSIGGV